ncbi:LysM peptidoglycan-binding domain-containing protein [Cytobacillus firmus]|uniref:LysM peptidoglycan-binding domain-containing protein n=1 Tax=Cytobacillus firmus TaxID=1399 RepID=UPI00385055D2
MKKQMVSIAAAAMLSSAFASQASADTYTVKKGDTLFHLAIKYKTTVTDIKKANNLSSDFLSINQKLEIPGAAAEKPESNQPSGGTTAPAPANTAKTYTVKSGDTLSKIALSHNISLKDLMSWNGLSTHLIYPGQVFKVSKSAGNTSGDTGEQAGSAPAPSSPANGGSPEVYIVKKGDTLGGIAAKYKTTVQQIKAWNKLSSDLILIGQKLNLSADKDSNESVSSGKPDNNEQTSGAAASVLAEAQKHVGVPYQWGGQTPSGFDCSGFIYYVLKQTGSKMVRYSSEGYYSRSFYVNTPQPGDLVFFENTYKKGISHLGFYVGNNKFIHAGSSGVEVSSLDNSYWKKHFDGFKRFY